MPVQSACRMRECSALPPEDCLFCKLVAEGDHVAKADGFVAIRDISEFPDEEAGRMLRFVAETAEQAGLDNYRVLVNVGAGAGQTVFHLHWHVLGGRPDAVRIASALAEGGK